MRIDIDENCFMIATERSEVRFGCLVDNIRAEKEEVDINAQNNMSNTIYRYIRRRGFQDGYHMSENFDRPSGP